jgi:putative transposase
VHWCSVPWKAHRIMSLKIEFVEKASAGANVAALCREYGISRQTGHKWLRRYREQGYSGLEEQSRRPKGTPLATGEEVVAAILALRESHPRWGARKLVHLLRKEFGDAAPSERTIVRVLERFGRIRKRVTRRGPSLVERAPTIVAKAPNDVWTIDFKGWWRAIDGQRCEPLTVRDAYSRFVLAVVMLDRNDEAHVRAVLVRLFSKHGVPAAIQCDNGSPFISVRARAGLTRLSVWWISLGIQVVRSRIGCPQDNGAHERMHADMAADLQSAPERSKARQQRSCDRWRQEFNHVRPHEALQGRTPAELYRSSPTKLREKVPVYPAAWLTRRVSKSGHIGIGTQAIFISVALAGRTIALESIGGLRWRVWFHQVDLDITEFAPNDLAMQPSRQLAYPRRVA